jgi:hypothetical protein
MSFRFAYLYTIGSGRYKFVAQKFSGLTDVALVTTVRAD